jgi:hypothetical protein
MHPAQLTRVRLLHDIMILIGRFNNIHLQQTHFGPTITKQHSTNTFWAHYYKTEFIINKHIVGPLLQNCIHLQQTHFGPTIQNCIHLQQTHFGHYYRDTPSITGKGEAISWHESLGWQIQRFRKNTNMFKQTHFSHNYNKVYENHHLKSMSCIMWSKKMT